GRGARARGDKVRRCAASLRESSRFLSAQGRCVLRTLTHWERNTRSTARQAATKGESHKRHKKEPSQSFCAFCGPLKNFVQQTRIHGLVVQEAQKGRS